MKRENDEITDLFRNRLSNTELKVRDNFWEELQQEIPVVTRRRHLAMIRFSAAASVLLVLAGASAAFWYFSPKDEIAEAFSQIAITETPKGNLNKDYAILNELPPVDPVVVANNYTPRVRPVSTVDYTEEEEDSLSISFSMTFSFSSSEEYINNNNKRGNNSLAGSRNESTSGSSSAVTSSIVPKRKRAWSMKLYGGGNLGDNYEQGRAMQMFTSKNNSLNVNNAVGEVSRGDFLSEDDYLNYQKIAAAVSPSEQHTKVKHKLPFSIGLGVRKELSDRFALETGLVYTNLNSELTAGGDNDYYKQDQTLHYVGIPIKADYTIYDSKHFSLYASAGGMIEKCVSGHVKTDYYEDGGKTYSSKHSLKADPLQLSLTAAVGLQYKLNEKFALYAEPGIAYYFDDDSPVATIRKEKPINLNLLCGVRMTY